MSNYLRNLLKCGFVIVAMLTCTHLQADGPKISFAGYYFNSPEHPTFIGASAPESLVLLFEENAKAIFMVNHYKDFATDQTPLPLFLEILYGNAKPHNEQTKNLKQEIAKDKISNKVSKIDSLTIYEMAYEEKATLIVFDSARMDSWITIECKSLNASKLIKSIQAI